MTVNGKTRVLVVEDDIYLLSGIREILDLEGYAVMTANNGQEGLRVLKEHPHNPPDVIVSDIMMPYMDGFGFLQEVRKEDGWVNIPFIFLTARGEKPDKHQGALLGADVYLTKPFDAEDLLVAVSSQLKRKQGIVEVNRKKQEEEVDSLKRKILAVLNHEFRTPLTLVVAYADMLKDFTPEQRSDDELITFLKGVNSGADRLRRLIENFIILVEIDSGDAARTYAWRRREIHRLSDIVHDAQVQIALPDIRPREYLLHVPDDLPVFVADVPFLTIAIRELLDNAAKFSRDHQRIILNSRADATGIEISVTDFGRGIPPDELENIWLPLYQIKREKFEDQGSGSGLAIVDGILKIHGGQRFVVSRDNEGSTFTLRLPLHPPGA
jgi:signal transduction histidine kinase